AFNEIRALGGSHGVHGVEGALDLSARRADRFLGFQHSGGDLLGLLRSRRGLQRCDGPEEESHGQSCSESGSFHVHLDYFAAVPPGEMLAAKSLMASWPFAMLSFTL